MSPATWQTALAPCRNPCKGCSTSCAGRFGARAVGVESIAQAEHEIVIRPVPTNPPEQIAPPQAGLGGRLVSRRTPVRLNARHLPDWKAALDAALTEIEATAATLAPLARSGAVAVG